jgi:hypothetical protein
MTLAELTAITRAGPAVIMVAKDDMLAMLEWRARVAQELGSILWMIQHGSPITAEEYLKDLLRKMKENGK